MKPCVGADSNMVSGGIQVYRSYIALGQYDIVQSEIADDAQPALQAVKLLGSYMESTVPRPTSPINRALRGSAAPLRI